MLREKYHQCGRRSSATDSPSWMRFLGYAMRVRIRQRARRSASLAHLRSTRARARILPLEFARARPYDAGTGKDEPGAGGAPQGAASGRQGKRSRCGDRAERDHPCTVREPEATVETEPSGQPGREGHRGAAGVVLRGGASRHRSDPRERRMAEGGAPRSSELRRSDDYSGPSSFLGCCAASSLLVSYPFGTVHR
jgi:hypothetical protein